MDTLHFERYEHKYIVPEAILDSVRRFVQPYVVPDRNAAGRPGGRYAIYNVYLDTPGLDFFLDGIDDAVDRIKLRIRWYDAEAKGPFFFEVKRKIRRVIIKDRARITREQLDAIADRRVPHFPEGPVPDRLTGFLDRALSTGAAPTVLCSYTREPYESVFGEYARITFDRAVRFQEADGFRLPGDPGAWKYVDAGWAMRGIRCASIIEMKFTTEYPRWMSDLVAEFGLELCGYSKYGSAMLHRNDTMRGGRDFQRCAATIE